MFFLSPKVMVDLGQICIGTSAGLFDELITVYFCDHDLISKASMIYNVRGWRHLLCQKTTCTGICSLLDMSLNMLCKNVSR